MLLSSLVVSLALSVVLLSFRDTRRPLLSYLVVCCILAGVLLSSIAVLLSSLVVLLSLSGFLVSCCAFRVFSSVRSCHLWFVLVLSGCLAVLLFFSGGPAGSLVVPLFLWWTCCFFAVPAVFSGGLAILSGGSAVLFGSLAVLVGRSVALSAGSPRSLLQWEFTDS